MREVAMPYKLCSGKRNPRWAVRILVLCRLALVLALGLLLLAPVSPVVANGNSEAAKACQQGGHLGLTRVGGTPFGNTGDCVSYVAQGGTLTPVPPPVVIKINEVESNAGVPGDWVELYNAGTDTADLSGYRFLDNDDAHPAYVLPAGTTLAAGGYLVLEEGATFQFGLGAADSARLFDPAGTLVDSYSWTSHAATTYGRCPNGIGVFTTTASPTKGGANACGL
jgi:hypothetical protein